MNSYEEIDYTYKSIITDNVVKRDHIDELLDLYEEEITVKEKKSVWKKILFLFSKNKK